MSLRLAVGDLQPMVAGTRQKKVDGFLVRRGHGLVLEEKASAIKIERVRRAGYVFRGFGHSQNFAVMLIHPGVEPVERFDRGSDVDVDTEIPQTAKTGRDVKRDVIV